MSAARLPLLVALATAGLALPDDAGATTGLEWQWEEPRRFLLQTQVHLSEVMWFMAEHNREVRVAEFRVQAVTTCAPAEELGKKKWLVHCSIDDLSLQAAPVVHEKGMLAEILEEMDDKFTGARVDLVLTRDGRIRNLDLEGVDKRNRRVSEIHESMRLMMARTFATLDLELPRKGDDKDKPWKDRNPLAMAFPSDQGTMGAVRLEHEVTGAGEEEGLVELTSSGRGTLGSGEMIEVQGQERPRNMYEMRMDGAAVFDTASGHLVSREYVVEGVATPGSVLAEAGEGARYVQAAHLQWVPPGAEVAELPATEELPAIHHPEARSPLMQRKE